ncbi:MAG: hypothetical protein DPW14_05665 [Planctomycetes bacterium]|nr:hypothetical protein [Planctomycetota bacterium]
MPRKATPQPVPAPSTTASMIAVEDFLSGLRALTPHRFEEFCGDLLQRQGFTILERPSLGTDGGADIVARFSIEQPRLFEEKWIVQCKWSAKPNFAVSLKHLGSFPAVCTEKGACGYLLITNGVITSDLQRKMNAHSGPTPEGYLKAAAWVGTEICDRVMTRCLKDVGGKWFPEWATRVAKVHSIPDVYAGLDRIMDALGKGDTEEATAAVTQMKLRKRSSHE